jgi:hypothetical protein
MLYEAYSDRFLCSFQEHGLDELIQGVVQLKRGSKVQHFILTFG